MAVVPIASDTFTGGPDTDIDGRALDGGGTPALAQGTYATHPEYPEAGGGGGPNLLQIVGGVLVKIGQNDRNHLITGVTGLGTDQGGRITFRFPATEVGGTPSARTLLYADGFGGTAGTSLAGRALDGAGLVAAAGAWVRDDGNAGSGQEVRVDGAGRAYQPARDTPLSASNYAVYRATGLTLPDDYDVEYDVIRTMFVNLAGRSNGWVGVPVRMQDPLGSGDPDRSYWHLYQVGEPTEAQGIWHSRIGNGRVGALNRTGQVIAIDDTVTLEVRVRGGTVTTYYGATELSGITFFDGQFGAALKNYDSGPPGLRFEAGGTGEENSYRMGEMRIYGITPGIPDTGGFELARVEVAVNHDATLDRAFILSLEFEHGPASTPPVLSFYLYQYLETSFPILRAAFQVMEALHDQDYTLELRREGAILTSLFNDVEVFDPFVLGTSAPVQGTPDADLTGGVVAINLNDGSWEGLWVSASLVEVLDTDTLCWADPDNPNPPQGPIPPTLLESALYVKQGGVWAEVDVPSLSNTGSVHGHAQLLARSASEMLVRHQGLWVIPQPEESTPAIDPDDPDVPPYDPRCIDDFPIDYPPPPPAAVGTKKLALYNLTSSLLGDYSPALASILGSSPGSYAGMQSALLARGMEWWMIPAFRKEQTTDNSNHGPYDHTATMAKFATWSGTAYNTAVLKYVVGYDEYNCSTCWVGSPPTFAQVSAGCSALAGYFSGVPISVRVSPANMLRNDGAVPAGVSVGMAQFHTFPKDGARTLTDYLDMQGDAAATLGLSGVCYGMDPVGVSVNGVYSWRWPDSYLEDVFLQIVNTAPMLAGVYFWCAGPPPMREWRRPGTNAALQVGATALAALP